jgi:hypothetical protein
VFSNRYAAVFHLDDPTAGGDVLGAGGDKLNLTPVASPLGGAVTIESGGFVRSDVLGSSLDAEGTIEINTLVETNAALNSSQVLFGAQSDSSLVLRGNGDDARLNATFYDDTSAAGADIIRVMPDNRWVHVALSWSGTQSWLWVREDNTGLDPAVSNIDLTGLTSQLQDSWPYAVDEFRISTVARSSSWSTANGRQAIDELLIIGNHPEVELELEPPAGDRTAGEALLFRFNEAAGETSAVSSDGSETMLAFEGGAEMIGGAVQLLSTGIGIASVPSAVHTACTMGTGLTVEAWVQPDHLFQEGPARFLSWSGGLNERNFSLSLDRQAGGSPRWSFRIRTANDSNSENFDYNFDVDPGRHRRHVVMTWSQPLSGQLKAYVDGVQRGADRQTPGSVLTDWSATYPVIIGDELGGGRPFLGRVYLAAIYCRPLSGAEVLANFLAGSQ